MTPLRRRLFLLSGASLVPLAVLAAFGIRVLRAEQTRELQRIGQELSRSIANAVSAELQVPIVALSTLATASTLLTGDLETFRDRLQRLLRQHPGWHGILLARPDGTVVLDTRATAAAPAPPLDMAAEIADAAAARQPRIGRLAQDHEQRWYFAVHVPAVEGADVQYVLSALVSPSVIHDAVARQRVPADWIISIVDRHNLRVARSRAHEENVGGPLSTSAQAIVASGAAEGFGISTSLEGDRIYTPYTRLPNGWAAVLGLPTASADAAVWRAIAVYGGGVLLSIGLGLLGAAWVGSTITRPIGDLENAAVALGQRRQPQAPVTGIREIGDVGAALVAAAEQLRQSDAERTAALARERAARQRAEAADRAKDEFLGILSHELRTPLNAVYGWSHMLQTGQLRDEAAAARARNAIVRNAEIQMRMIDDLLDLSRITSGKIRIDLQNVNLAHVLDEAVEAVRPAAAAKRLTLHTSVSTPLPTLVGDPARLQQVFWNLLMNAVKFTPAGGRVDVDLFAAGPDLRIVVRDTGEGIAADVLPHVFERFRQGDSSSTRSHGGLGLGLSLVRHYTELHGGRVEAASAGPGQGATFTVTLPVLAPALDDLVRARTSDADPATGEFNGPSDAESAEDEAGERTGHVTVRRSEKRPASDTSS